MQFAKSVRNFIKKIPQSIVTTDDAKQLIRSSGSIGANYIEANEAGSKKDFQFRVRIAKKEAKETVYWLRLIDVGNVKQLQDEGDKLKQEAVELMNILGAILQKTSN